MTKKKNIDEHIKDHNTENKTNVKKDKAANNTDTEAETPENIKGDAGEKIPVKEEKADNQAEVKLAEMTDKYLRLSAEFDNYRKRTLREKMELTKSAGEDILINLIPVMDDFERAMKLMESTQDCIAMKSGIELIYNKFLSFLKQQGVKEIEALNKNFDVDLHEAITKVPSPAENMKGKVVDVVEKGYYLNDKIMRFSKVVVGE